MEDHHMNNNDDFAKNVSKKLDQLAHSHQNKHRVMQHVFTQIEQPTKRITPIWKMTGFALAAVATGFLVFPNVTTLSTKGQNTQTMMNTNTTKLSPQMVEDLEMVMVFGEDTHSHGS